jgi:hypothetical protein
VLREKINSIQGVKGVQLPAPQKIRRQLMLSQAEDIRKCLRPADRLRLYQMAEKPELYLEEILECQQMVSQSLYDEFWDSLLTKIEHDSPLHHHVPDSVRKKIEERRRREQRKLEDKEKKAVHSRYAKFFSCVKGITKSPRFTYHYKTKVACENLTKNDRMLAATWLKSQGYISGKNREDYEMARVLSARVAERVAFQFYKSLEYPVVDISITQLNSGSQDWKTHDLLVDSQHPVDVKNARPPVSVERRFVEHCVPKFKESRRLNQEVVIAGVLSPYLILYHILGPASIAEYIEPIYFLGEVRPSEICRLEGVFKQADLKLRIIDRGVVPAWMYDYPSRCYIGQNNYTNVLKSLDISTYPSFEDCTLIGENLIPILIAAGIPLPPTFIDQCSSWQNGFIRKIQELRDGRVTLPVLFLALLSHFLEMVKADEASGVGPDQYRRLLYSSNNNENPLGIVDPLGIISEFLNTLGVLWEYRNILALGKYSLFKFNGSGLLQGQSKDEAKLITLLAYCGGFVEGKGKCGASPLIKGQEQTCPECGKLICGQCGFCSKYCKTMEKRLQIFEPDRTYQGTHLSYNDADGKEDIPF